MNFEEFCAYVKENIRSYLPEEYEQYGIALGDSVRVNQGTLVGLTMVAPGYKTNPIQYLNEHYEAYATGVPLYEVMGRIASTVLEYEMKREPQMEELAKGLEDFSEVADRIMLSVVGVSYNKDLLERAPHQIQGDIAATYRILVDNTAGITASALVTDQIMQRYHLTQPQLHELAVKNTMQAFPAQLTTLQGVCTEMKREDILEEIKHDPIPMFIITNNQMFHGAAVAFYPDFFENMGLPIEDYYILPSSIHEFILCPKQLCTLEQANQMVQEVNATFVDPGEVLSDYAHEYNPQTKQLVIGGTLLKQELQQEEPEQRFDFGIPAYTM